MMQIVQELCKRPGLNRTGFDMPTIYVPSMNQKVSMKKQKSSYHKLIWQTYVLKISILKWRQTCMCHYRVNEFSCTEKVLVTPREVVTKIWGSYWLKQSMNWWYMTASVCPSVRLSVGSSVWLSVGSSVWLSVGSSVNPVFFCLVQFETDCK